MKNQINIGCSSYYNRLWKGIFYPEDLPSKEWFTFYCEHFNTYEFNGSFYKFPTIRIFENWYKKTPDKFLIAVKAPKEITHVRKFVDCENLLTNFYKVAETGLKDKLGAVLFQFPPSFKFSTENLQLIVKTLNLSFINVVEFRHESWWNLEVWDAFSSNNITFCSVSYPNLPEMISVNGPLIYMRLHGKPKLFYSSYTAEELRAIKFKIAKNEAFVYFNNTASAAGIINAVDFKAL